MAPNSKIKFSFKANKTILRFQTQIFGAQLLVVHTWHNNEIEILNFKNIYQHEGSLVGKALQQKIQHAQQNKRQIEQL